jgi:hypothetical protein
MGCACGASDHGSCRTRRGQLDHRGDPPDEFPFKLVAGGMVMIRSIERWVTAATYPV